MASRMGSGDNPDNLAMSPTIFAKDIFEDPMINQCPLPFAAYHLKQSDLSLVNSYKYSNTVMGTATVALSVNGQLYFGTYHGDRIASVEISKE